MNQHSLLQKIKEEFPSLKWKKYRYLSHGWDHEVITLDDKIVFRAPKNKEYQNLLKNEIKLLKYLKNKVKVGIPEYKYISKDKTIAGYNILPGQELTPSLFKKLSKSNKELIAKKLADFLTTIHSTPKSILKRYHIKSEDPKKLSEELIQDTRKIIFPKLPKKDIHVIEKYFLELKEVKHHYSRTLTHGDLVHGHILWDNKKKQINIIDFSDRAINDPAIDFAELPGYGQKFIEQVLKHYKGKKDQGMMGRAQLYDKMISLSEMRASLQGLPTTFRKGYKMFRSRFYK